jgi:hypothetical protein
MNPEGAVEGKMVPQPNSEPEPAKEVSPVDLRKEAEASYQRITEDMRKLFVESSFGGDG